jgi:hypothetical protein
MTRRAMSSSMLKTPSVAATGPLWSMRRWVRLAFFKRHDGKVNFGLRTDLKDTIPFFVFVFLIFFFFFFFLFFFTMEYPDDKQEQQLVGYSLQVSRHSTRSTGSSLQ